MANSRIMLVCKHCGEGLYLGKGYMGAYFTRDTDLCSRLNEFFDEHEYGSCSENDFDCSDNARNHFVILEEGETLADVAPKSEIAREIFEDILKIKGLELNDWLAIAELKKKYTGEQT